MPEPEPMRVVINGRFLDQDVTGVQRVAREFVHALDRMVGQGHFADIEFEIVAPRGSTSGLPTLDNIPIRRIGRLHGHAWEQLELPGAAEGTTLLCLGNVAPVRSLRSSRTRVVVMVHDLSYRYFPDAYSRLFRAAYNWLIPQVLRHSDHVFTVSESERVAITRHYPWLTRARLSVVQNGGGWGTGDTVPPARDRRQHRVLYVGSLTARKNAAGLLSAATELCAKDPQLHFDFVGGSGEAFSASGLVSTAHSERIRFHGQVNDPGELAEFYTRSMVFCFPSFYEASPLPPIEAMAHGLPVACSDIPSLRERCGDASVYCDPYDLDSIVRAVRELLDDEAAWSDLQQKGRARASQYDWSNQVEVVMRTIESLGRRE